MKVALLLVSCPYWFQLPANITACPWRMPTSKLPNFESHRETPSSVGTFQRQFSDLRNGKEWKRMVALCERRLQRLRQSKPLFLEGPRAQRTCVVNSSHEYCCMSTRCMWPVVGSASFMKSSMYQYHTRVLLFTLYSTVSKNRPRCTYWSHSLTNDMLMLVRFVSISFEPHT